MGSPKDCVFCKIASGAINSTKLFEDDSFICVRDIQPQAKIHLLIIPKEHIASLDEAYPLEGKNRGDIVARMFETATKVARKEKLLPGGFRSVVNTNRDGGQTVFHLHLHILGGEPLGGAFG